MEREILDYQNLNIYAEGTWEKCENLREYLLRSVSVEFEYVNIIYEKNIKKGFIRDALYTYEKLIQKLRESEQIVIKDIGENTLAVSDWLAKSRIDNYCFLTKDNMGEKYVLGKPLYNLNELMKNRWIFYLIF